MDVCAEDRHDVRMDAVGKRSLSRRLFSVIPCSLTAVYQKHHISSSSTKPLLSVLCAKTCTYSVKIRGLSTQIPGIAPCLLLVPSGRGAGHFARHHSLTFRQIVKSKHSRCKLECQTKVSHSITKAHSRLLSRQAMG